MGGAIYRRDTCRFCGGRNLELVVQLTPTPVGLNYLSAERLHEVQDSFPIDIFLCLDCGYTGLLDVVDPGDLFDDSTEITSRSLGVAESLQQLADYVLRRLNPPKNSLVVDIGSNDGTLLKCFQNQGMRVLGVDPARHAADSAIASGIPTMRTFFTTEAARNIKNEFGPAQIITANRVLANIDDFGETIAGVRDLLAPDGTFVFETGYLVDVLEHCLIHTVYHEHLGYCSVKPLDAFYRRLGMELVDVERISIKGGSLRGMVQQAGGQRKVEASVAQLIDLETRLGVDRPRGFQNFSARINKLNSQLETLIRDLKAEGKTIAGYGASVGSVTMIYHFGLGDILDFLVDDDPRNQDTFTPGHHIPVVSPQRLYDRKPDYVVILAWRYADPIIEQHQKYLDQGGHFILPMPDLKVI